MKQHTVEGNLNAAGHTYAIIAARFNHFIVEHLVAGAIDTLVRHGCDPDAITIYRAPGGFELPLVTQRVANQGKVDAIIVLGAVIRGATPHFDFVASEATKGLSAISLEANIPVTNGVLTCDTIEQAIERAGTKAGNKGAEAAISAVEMVNLLQNISAKGAS